MNAHAVAATASTQFARSALRYLAERRPPPTPDQYSLAWRAVGGSMPILASSPALLQHCSACCQT